MDIQYTELKKVIIDGCNHYENARQSKNKRLIKGFYNGNQGLGRVSKTKKFAESFDENSEPFLFLALLLALFDTSSKDLTACIIRLLIQGQEVSCGVYDDDYNATPTADILETLKSPGFSKKMLTTAGGNTGSFNGFLENEGNPIMILDKKQCVYTILRSAAPQQNVFFKHVITGLKKQLDKTDSSEIDVTGLKFRMILFVFKRLNLALKNRTLF